MSPELDVPAPLAADTAMRRRTDCEPAGESPGASGSVLRRLGLDDDELMALRSQGFVSREQRSPGHAPVFKLRFRIDGKQRTRYLGSDSDVIAAVRQELAELREEAQRGRKLRRLARQARCRWQRAKSELEPLLAAEGYHFHGLLIRKRRATFPRGAESTEPPPLL